MCRGSGCGTASIPIPMGPNSWVTQTPSMGRGWECGGGPGTLPCASVPRGPHPSQEVVLAYDVPVPHLHAQHGLPQLALRQLKLQHLVPVRETGFLNHLLGTGTGGCGGRGVRASGSQHTAPRLTAVSNVRPQHDTRAKGSEVPERSRGARSLRGGGGQLGRSRQGACPCQHSPCTPVPPLSPASPGHPWGSRGGCWRERVPIPHSSYPKPPPPPVPGGQMAQQGGGRGALLSLLAVPMAIPLPWYPLRLPWQRDAASAAWQQRVRAQAHTHADTRVHTRTHQSRGAAWGVPQFPPILKPKGRNLA